MGLFLTQEQMWDMSFDGESRKDKEKRATHWAGNALWVIIGFICKVCFRYEVTGRENLRPFKGKSGVLMVCNHTSFLDVVFVYLATRTKQWARFVARESLFQAAGGLLGQIISRVGAFPIKRDSADLTAVKRAARMLKDKEVVCILPEGTRRGKGSLAPELHSGAALIARMGKAPILPMTVREVENVKRKGERLRFPKVTIEYGQPILLSDFDFLPKEERLEGCTWYAMREVFALSKRVPADQVDMRELFPNAKDYADVFAAHPVPTHTTEELVGA